MPASRENRFVELQTCSRLPFWPKPRACCGDGERDGRCNSKNKLEIPEESSVPCILGLGSVHSGSVSCYDCGKSVSWLVREPVRINVKQIHRNYPPPFSKSETTAQLVAAVTFRPSELNVCFYYTIPFFEQGVWGGGREGVGVPGTLFS